MSENSGGVITRGFGEFSKILTRGFGSIFRTQAFKKKKEPIIKELILEIYLPIIKIIDFEKEIKLSILKELILEYNLNQTIQKENVFYYQLSINLNRTGDYDYQINVKIDNQKLIKLLGFLEDV